MSSISKLIENTSPIKLVFIVFVLSFLGGFACNIVKQLLH